MRKSYFLPIIIITTLHFSVFSTAFAQKGKLKKHILSIEDSLQAHMGVLLYDPSNNKEVFNYKGHQRFTPASNMKVFTYWTAVTHLPDSTPTFKYTQRHDTLYFTGCGDPSLLNPNFEAPPLPAFLQDSTLHYVYLPDTLYDTPLGEGWMWDDEPYYYSAQRANTPIYGNIYSIEKDTVGTMKFTPDYFFSNTNLTHHSTKTTLRRADNTNDFSLCIHDEDDTFEKTVTFQYSDSLFVQMLSDITGNDIQLSYAQAPHWEKTFSAYPIDSLFNKLLYDSDNEVAEQLLLMSGKVISDSLSEAPAIREMLATSLAPVKEDLYWVDGSGLSRYNLITPNAMIYVLDQIYKSDTEEKWKIRFPQAGHTGTLKKMYDKTSQPIYAKSGSMHGVYNISGFLYTKTGKMLLFSILNNHFTTSVKDARKASKGLLDFIMDNY